MPDQMNDVLPVHIPTPEALIAHLDALGASGTLATKQAAVAAFVFRGLAAQGCASALPARDGKAGACLYRGPNDTKCAAGLLMADADYSPDMEGDNVASVAQRGGAASTLFRIADHVGVGLLEILQAAHDAASGDENFMLGLLRRFTDRVIVRMGITPAILLLTTP